MKRWTKNEIRFLREMCAAGFSQARMVRELRRTPAAIDCKLRRIKYKSHRYHTETARVRECLRCERGFVSYRDARLCPECQAANRTIAANMTDCL